MAVIIAGEKSGVGKTTVTLALLSFLASKKKQIQSFKVGPDYIDPMFHTTVTNRPCRNLDPLLTSCDYVKSTFIRHCQSADYAIVEGVMGLFDGVEGDKASTAHIARLLDLPVLLVIDCSRLSGSVAAIAFGYTNFDPRVKIAGLVLNKVGSDRHQQLLLEALKPLNIPVLGIIKRTDNITIPDRHLGLVPSAEIKQLNLIFEQLADLAAKSFALEQLLPLLTAKKTLSTSPHHNKTLTPPDRRGAGGDFLEGSGEKNSSVFPAQTKEKIGGVKIGIACDRAFNFYYQDNLDIFQELGAELIPFSPLTDKSLPAGIQGLYFGGGFPEVFAQELAANKPVQTAVKKAITRKIPTIAECGGLMYLSQQIVDFSGKNWDMVGVLPTTAVMGKTLTLGYRQATALQDNPLLTRGETLIGHEFHRSMLTSTPENPLFQSKSYSAKTPSYLEGWGTDNLHASYLHLHFGNRNKLLKRFLEHCRLVSKKKLLFF